MATKHFHANQAIVVLAAVPPTVQLPSYLILLNLEFLIPLKSLYSLPNFRCCLYVCLWGKGYSVSGAADGGPEGSGLHWS